jgi:hypothetical protein
VPEPISKLPTAVDPIARALPLDAEDLAQASALGVTTIRRAELTESETSLTAVNDLAFGAHSPLLEFGAPALRLIAA